MIKKKKRFNRLNMKVPSRLTLSCVWRCDGLPVSCKWQSSISEVMTLCNRRSLALPPGWRGELGVFVSTPCPVHTCNFLSGYLHDKGPHRTSFLGFAVGMF